MDINNATKVQLETLQGIGDARALSIIKARKDAGGQLSAEDFMSMVEIPQAVWTHLFRLNLVSFSEEDDLAELVARMERMGFASPNGKDHPSQSPPKTPPAPRQSPPRQSPPKTSPAQRQSTPKTSPAPLQPTPKTSPVPSLQASPTSSPGDAEYGKLHPSPLSTPESSPGLCKFEVSTPSPERVSAFMSNLREQLAPEHPGDHLPLSPDEE